MHVPGQHIDERAFVEVGSAQKAPMRVIRVSLRVSLADNLAIVERVIVRN